MKIGLLQTGHAPDAMIAETGDYDALFRQLLDGRGFDFDTYAVVDGQFPPGADAAEGWLITGSRHGAYDDLPWIAPLEALVRDIVASGRPLVGVCFGHQIIAQAMGGKVEKFAAGWAVGPTDYDRDGQTVTVNAWHQDQVTVRPPGARVLAGNAFCENAILAYGDTVWTIQPHPEFDAAFIDGLIRTRGKGLVPQPLLDRALADLDRPTDRMAIAREIGDFLLHAKAPA